MEKFKNVVIGFGKAGKTLAKFLAQHDEEVLLIERSDQMYGGTCINVGCLPSKNMIINGQRHLEFADAVAKRGTMTKQLRNKRTITWLLMSRWQRFGMARPVLSATMN